MGERRTCEALLRASRRAYMPLHCEGGGLTCHVYVMANRCQLQIAQMAQGRLPQLGGPSNKMKQQLARIAYGGCCKPRKRMLFVVSIGHATLPTSRFKLLCHIEIQVYNPKMFLFHIIKLYFRFKCTIIAL
jgi:hypothetical protein